MNYGFCSFQFDAAIPTICISNPYILVPNINTNVNIPQVSNISINNTKAIDIQISNPITYNNISIDINTGQGMGLEIANSQGNMDLQNGYFANNINNGGEVTTTDSSLQTALEVIGYITAAINIATSITDLVITIESYKDQKDLLNKQIEALKDQIKFTQEEFQRQKDELARAKRIYNQVNELMKSAQQIKTQY